MGCAHQVFATEIDVKLFQEAERGKGYGSLKLAREPLARCAFTVEKAHEQPGVPLPQPALRGLPGIRPRCHNGVRPQTRSGDFVKDRLQGQTRGRNRA